MSIDVFAGLWASSITSISWVCYKTRPQELYTCSVHTQQHILVLLQWQFHTVELHWNVWTGPLWQPPVETWSYHHFGIWWGPGLDSNFIFTLWWLPLSFVDFSKLSMPQCWFIPQKKLINICIYTIFTLWAINAVCIIFVMQNVSVLRS